MIGVSTGSAVKCLPVAGLGIYVTAFCTGLRTVGSRHLDELPSRPLQLVSKHLFELGPARISNASRQITFDHPGNVEFLDDDGAVALGQSCRLDMQGMLALTPDLSVQAHYANLGFFSVLRSFLSAGHNSLSTSKPFQRLLKMFRILREFAIGIRKQMGDTYVNSYDRINSLDGVSNVDLTENRSEPLISIASDSAGLRLAFERSVNNSAKVSEFRESNIGSLNSPSLWVGLTQPKRINTLALPTWLSSKLLEAALPRLIEFNEKLSADVPRHVGKPGKFSAKRCEFVDLVECGRVDLIGSTETRQTLFESEVPEPSKSTFPLLDPSNLLLGRIDSETKALADDHVQSGINQTTPEAIRVR